MAVLSQLSELELFLMTVENDEEDSPWMVMADLQVRSVDLLKPILLLHAEQHRLPWYVASYLLITTPRPIGDRTLEAAPDLLVAQAADVLRTSWSVLAEGKAPEFVLEVSSGKSWGRDSGEKPRIYGSMGVTEYVMFAPERKDGPKLLGWRRDDADQFVQWHVDSHGVLWCRTLGGLGLYVEGGLWLRAQDVTGRRLPTPGELMLVERRRADAEATARADAERRAAVDAAARAAAEAEVTRLREELRRLRGDQEPSK
jgi:Uma2 family endonuclease